MAPRVRDGTTDTATRILGVAERLVQRRGFNGFSYADVATELDVTKASLHYHFRGKAELGVALVARYAARFGDERAAIDARASDARAKLAAFADLYGTVLRDGRMCLCGMLAAEYETLPEPMRDAVVGFFDENEAWLADVLEQGRSEGTLRFDGPARDTARALVGALEGALLLARPTADVTRFEADARRLLGGLTRTAS